MALAGSVSPIWDTTLTLEIKVAIKEYMPSALATRHPDHYSVALTGRVEEDYQYGMERFLDEAKILAKLQNTPHIVSVQNYFKENGTAYFVMEYIDGMSLKAYLAKNGDKIPYNQAIAILQPIMEALVQVHALNLLHRDISPDNIYITSKGESRLLDFGAARFALGDGKSVSVILKHGYAPEEQYSQPRQSGTVDGCLRHGRYPVPLHYRTASARFGGTDPWGYHEKAVGAGVPYSG